MEIAGLRYLLNDRTAWPPRKDAASARATLRSTPPYCARRGSNRRPLRLRARARVGCIDGDETCGSGRGVICFRREGEEEGGRGGEGGGQGGQGGRKVGSEKREGGGEGEWGWGGEVGADSNIWKVDEYSQKMQRPFCLLPRLLSSPFPAPPSCSHSFLISYLPPLARTHPRTALIELISPSSSCFLLPHTPFPPPVPNSHCSDAS
jgi:hypothetical protein